ncbi:hypothetical protein LXT21_37890 [Myxococcus sp. K38C18041901]|nr:hypothetical protein [Myxococcus guangdongensis]
MGLLPARGLPSRGGGAGAGLHAGAGRARHPRAPGGRLSARRPGPGGGGGLAPGAGGVVAGPRVRRAPGPARGPGAQAQGAIHGCGGPLSCWAYGSP